MTRRLSSWKSLAALLVIAMFALRAGHAEANRAATERAERIRRVESELLPVTATHSRLGQYASLRERMRAYGVPGISIAVIDGGRIDWAKGYGIANFAPRAPVTPDTLFQAASISKPVAAFGSLILVARGKLGLDTDVNRYLRGWHVPTNRMTDIHPVTLRTLLDHSAGLTDVPGPDYRPGESAPTLLQRLDGAGAAIRIESVPGQQYRYSAISFAVLQLLMEDVTSSPFATYMQANVLAPLHMTHSTFDEPLPTALIRSAAMGYYSGGAPVPGGYRFGPELAVAGLWTTPSDLARYVIEVQRDYAGTHRGLLSPAIAKQMLSAQIAYRGLGVVMSGRGEDIRFGHDGFNYGFESAMVGYVHHGQGAVVMANSGVAYMLIKEVMASIARVYHWPHYDWTNQWPPATPINQQEVTTIPARVIAASTGRYLFDNNQPIDIYAKGDRLFLHYPGNGSAEIFRTPGDTFFCPQLTFSDFGDPRLRFKFGRDGRVDRIIASYGHLVLTRMNDHSRGSSP